MIHTSLPHLSLLAKHVAQADFWLIVKFLVHFVIVCLNYASQPCNFQNFYTIRCVPTPPQQLVLDPALMIRQTGISQAWKYTKIACVPDDLGKWPTVYGNMC